MALRFRTLGRSSQAIIETPEDLAAVVDLEDALWVATAATVDTLRLDKGFLSAIDTDGDGRIRSDEVRAAIRWLSSVLRDRSDVRGGVTKLKLASVAETGDGAAVLDGARRVLETVGTPASKELELAVVRKVRADEEAKGLSSAGKVLPAAAGDDVALRSFLDHVLEVTGGEKHPSGDAAVTGATLDTFLAQGKAWLAWNDQPSADAAILPVPATADALGAHSAVVAKFEQYFLLCDTVHLDPSLTSRAWIDATSTDLLDPKAATALLEKAPLARPRPDGVLDLSSGLNPAWRGRIEAWLEKSARALGVDVTRLDRAAVGAVGAKVAAYEAWQAARPATKAGDRGADALRAHLADEALPVRTRELLTRSEAAAVALDGVKLVEKTLLFQAWLMPLVNTMVSMPDLFDTTVPGWVERGKLVMDGRVFDLAIKVNDPGRAERFAAMSPLYTLFVRVGEKGGALDEEFMVPVTAGEREHLTDGMWGVFFDVDGRERHALVRKMIANPISIQEALMAPFRKIGETIQNTLDKAAASQTESMSSTVTTTATSAADKAAAAPGSVVAAGEAAKAAPAAPAEAAPPTSTATATAPAPSPMGNLPMLAAGVGIALGAIGAFVTTALSALFGATAVVSGGIGDLAAGAGLPAGAIAGVSYPFALILVMLGVVLVPFLIYAVPVSLATWFRLRRRDLSTLLEGSGWAINTRLYLDRELAVQLTKRPALPR